MNMVETIKQARQWLETVTFAEFREEIEDRIVGQKDLILVLAQVRNYIEAISYGRPINHNFILAAPSGSGKTETYRALRAYFMEHIPLLVISIVDVSQVTASGFRGAEPYEIVRDFFRKYDTLPYGICFLDEFDKKLAPSYSAQGTDTNAETQANLLTIVEGSRVTNRKGITINTSCIMFVGMGSFDAFRKKKEEEPLPVGFGAANETRRKITHISKEDMIESGALYELIGRFPIIVNYDTLSEEGIRKVIEKTAQLIGECFNCDIDIQDTYERYLFEKASSKFGCREIDSIIRESVLREYINTFDEKIENRVLVIQLLDKNKSAHKWREKTTKEKELSAFIESFADETNVFI